MTWNRFKFHLNTQNSYFSLQRKRLCVIFWWPLFSCFHVYVCIFVFVWKHVCGCIYMYVRVGVCRHLGPRSGSGIIVDWEWLPVDSSLVFGSDGHVLGLIVIIVQPTGTQEATKLHLLQRWMSQCVVVSHESSSQKTMRDISYSRFTK